jgi:hypothetical protein
LTIYSDASLTPVLLNAGFEPIEMSRGGPGGLLTFDQLTVVARATAVSPARSLLPDYAGARAAFERALATDWPYARGSFLGRVLRRPLRRSVEAFQRLVGDGDDDLKTLPGEVLESVRRGAFGREHARLLLALDDGAVQRRLWKRAVLEAWSRERVAEMVAAEPRPGERTPDAATPRGERHQ